jgi:hypothetical protein
MVTDGEEQEEKPRGAGHYIELKRVDGISSS